MAEKRILVECGQNSVRPVNLPTKKARPYIPVCSPPPEAWAVSGLPYTGQSISALENAPLPYTSKTHDLINLLSLVVKVDTAPHARKPAGQIVSTILDTKLLAHIVLSEMKQHNFSMKTLSSALGMNAATFSLSLREPRHWFDANPSQRRSYYQLFLWLNLKAVDRKTCFSRNEVTTLAVSDDCPVDHVPHLHLLTEAVGKELSRQSISIEAFAKKVVGDDRPTVHNMLFAPLPWEIVGVRLRKKYAVMWYWMKQPTSTRLGVLDTDCLVDTAQVAKEVLLALNQSHVTIADFAKDVLQHLPNAKVSSYLYSPVPWNQAAAYIKYVYVTMMRWLDMSVTERHDDESTVNSAELAGMIKKCLLENGITVTEFAERIVKLPRACVSAYINAPVEWTLAKEQQRLAYIVMAHWICLPLEKKVQKFQRLKPPTPPHKEPELELNKLVDSCKQKLTADELTTTWIDTSAVAAAFLPLVQTSVMTIKRFSASVQVNRNYFASLLHSPVPWESATKVQKLVYVAMKEWIHKQGLPCAVPTSSVVVPGVKKQTRCRFTAEQKALLNNAFVKNPRPSREEKLQLSQDLSLPLRSVVIFFSNRRNRGDLYRKWPSTK